MFSVERTCKFLFLAVPVATLIAACNGSSSFKVGCLKETRIGEAAHRIRNGTCVESGFENVMRMYIVTDQGPYLCTGTLIAANVVLSAGHCVNPASASPQFTISQIIVEQPRLGIGAYVTHYRFTGGAIGQPIESTDDMSVLRLDRNLAPTPATLAAQDPAVGQRMLALGYGFDGNAANGNGNSGDLLYGLVNVDFVGSSSKNIRTVSAVQPISEPNSQDTCAGDSGGPLFAENATNVIVGMLSGGYYVGLDTCKNSADSYWTPARWNSTEINNWKSVAQGIANNNDPAPSDWQGPL